MTADRLPSDWTAGPQQMYAISPGGETRPIYEKLPVMSIIY
jgi:hypothetical protein